MSKAAQGATVRYCGHKATFTADIFLVGNANVVRPDGPIDLKTLNTDEEVYKSQATHELVDFPTVGFWRPDLGVFVVPEKQVIKLRKYGGKPIVIKPY